MQRKSEKLSVTEAKYDFSSSLVWSSTSNRNEKLQWNLPYLRFQV